MKNVKRLFAVGTMVVLFLSVSFYATSKPSSALGKPMRRVWNPCTTLDGTPGTYGTCVAAGSGCTTLTECIPNLNQ